MSWNSSSALPSPAPENHVFVSPSSRLGAPSVNETCLEAAQALGDLLLANRTLHECACASRNISTSEFRHWNCGQFDPIIKTSFDVVILVSYISIMIVSLVGNTLVCYIVLSSARMRTVTNYLITNMAVGDLLMTLLCVPFTFSSVLLLQHWPFGATMCWLVSFTQAVSVFVSAFSLIAISVDRYRAIIYPLRPRVTRQHARLFILLIWLLAIGTCVPIAVTSRLWQPPHRRFILNDLYVCDEHWQQGSREQYSMAVMALQYFLPVLVLMYTYGRIALEVWGKTAALFEQRDPREARLARTRRKVSPARGSGN
ncbi:RYamide receptor-like [Amphibalanus amphitrite]|uniref:RYamide receptor-like n=1 Tax=Amphibalanus amphitrite TaxID=1232801 RepID=UPI001C8FFD55|nr:RYamide receptor-like [Amphibalanus amphitrite]